MVLVGLHLYRYELPLAEPFSLQGAKLRHREGLFSMELVDSRTLRFARVASRLGVRPVISSAYTRAVSGPMV